MVLESSLIMVKAIKLYLDNLGTGVMGGIGGRGMGVDGFMIA